MHVDPIWTMPEFIALCKRLGIDHDAPTTRLIIDISIDDVVRIEHRFMARDIPLKEPAPTVTLATDPAPPPPVRVRCGKCLATFMHHGRYLADAVCPHCTKS